MTTLSPPPNWYADPSGRHESRYWDGFTWTPHVADRGQPGLDPLVRTDPIAAVAPAAGSRQDDPIGPGTEALRTMATTRPEPASAGLSSTDPRVATVPPIRRRGVAFDVTAVIAVIVVVVLGGYVLWQGWDASSSPGHTDARGAVVWNGDGVRVDLVATDGSITRAVECVVVDGSGAATITLVGPADSVTRHLADARTVAESASLT